MLIVNFGETNLRRRACLLGIQQGLSAQLQHKLIVSAMMALFRLGDVMAYHCEVIGSGRDIPHQRVSESQSLGLLIL